MLPAVLELKDTCKQTQPNQCGDLQLSLLQIYYSNVTLLLGQTNSK